jgi:hypothetical protein
MGEGNVGRLSKNTTQGDTTIRGAWIRRYIPEHPLPILLIFEAKIDSAHSVRYGELQLPDKRYEKLEVPR